MVVSLGWWELYVCVGAVLMCINMFCMCEVRECGRLCLCLKEVEMAPCMLGRGVFTGRFLVCYIKNMQIMTC